MIRRRVHALMPLCAAILMVASVAADAPRTETQTYNFARADVDGCSYPVTAWEGVLCFPLNPGEAVVHFAIAEESPTAHLDTRIAARVIFEGSGAYDTGFCDNVTFWIPPATTRIRLEIQQGLRNSYCELGETELSGALYGTVTASFWG